MRHAFLYFLLIAVLAACEGNTKARKEARGEHYVADPNYLYFKNTRQRQYREEDRGEAGNYFYHDDLYASEATLLPVIWDKWLEDEAYLELHTRSGESPAGPSGQINLLISSKTGVNSVALQSRPDRAAVEQLNHQLNTNREINLVVDGDTLPAFPRSARDHAKEVLSDYLRLID